LLKVRDLEALLAKYDRNRASLMTFLASIVRFTDPKDVKTLYINSKLCKIISSEPLTFRCGAFGQSKTLSMAVVLQYGERLR
jgi:hypothetical protein